MRLILIVCLASLCSAPLLAGVDLDAELEPKGTVIIDGNPVLVTSTLRSGRTISTLAGSSAVIYLGKLGRVELLENSKIDLNFDQHGFTGIVQEGKVKVASNIGFTGTMTTSHGVAFGNPAEFNLFLVERECPHSHVESFSGDVVLRTANSDRKVGVGTSLTAGNLNTQADCSKPCMRLAISKPVATAGWLVPSLIAAGGGVVAAILLGTTGTNDIGGGVNVVSGIR